jgi:hypothetical protein
MKDQVWSDNSLSLYDLFYISICIALFYKILVGILNPILKKENAY